MKEHINRTSGHVAKVERFVCTYKCYNIFPKLYLAWTIVSFVNCYSKTAGICFLAVVSSFSRCSAHLYGLLYVSSENKKLGDTPESMGERRKTKVQRRKTGDFIRVSSAVAGSLLNSDQTEESAGHSVKS